MNKLILAIIIFISGCTNMPTRYGDTVIIKSGIYKNHIGKLVGDCSGFENYKVRVKERYICLRAWDMEVI